MENVIVIADWLKEKLNLSLIERGLKPVDEMVEDDFFSEE